MLPIYIIKLNSNITSNATQITGLGETLYTHASTLSSLQNQINNIAAPNLADYLRADGRSIGLDRNSDLNNFFSGVGLFSAATKNLPHADWFLVISGGTGGTVTQWAISLFGGHPISQRHCASGNWSGWYNPFSANFVVKRKQGYLNDLSMYASSSVNIDVYEANYTPMGVMGYKTDATAVVPHGTLLNGTTVTMNIANWSTTNQSGNVYVDILYKAN